VVSALVYGAPCDPYDFDLPGLGRVPAEPTHVGCSGGQTAPGLIGGWTCPCECHMRTKSSEAASDA
jgi:hypothetical protein